MRQAGRHRERDTERGRKETGFNAHSTMTVKHQGDRDSDTNRKRE